MSRFAAGSMTGDQLIKEFGIQQGNNPGAGYNAAAGATDSDKTKANSALGGGYLTNETYERLKGDARVKEAYAAVNGQEAADKKFKDGSISINTMDALFDTLTGAAACSSLGASVRVSMDALFDTLTEAPKEEQAAAPEAKSPVVLSERAAKAKAYTTAYEEAMLPRQGDYFIKNDQSVVNDFDSKYSLNLKKETQPQTPAVLAQAENEVDPAKAKAKAYAKDYKLALGDMLRPSDREF